MERSDYELVRDCLEGNSSSFSEIVTRYKKLVYSVAYKFTSDSEEICDISQDIFIKIYRFLDKYNPQYKFSTWVVKIATNICLDYVRKNKHNYVCIEEIENMPVENNSTPEAMLLKKEKSSIVRNAIDKLPDIYKQPIVMYHQKGMSYKEISEALNQPMSIVKNRIFRGRNTLKSSLMKAV